MRRVERRDLGGVLGPQRGAHGVGVGAPGVARSRLELALVRLAQAGQLRGVAGGEGLHRRGVLLTQRGQRRAVVGRGGGRGGSGGLGGCSDRARDGLGHGGLVRRVEGGHSCRGFIEFL